MFSVNEGQHSQNKTVLQVIWKAHVKVYQITVVKSKFCISPKSASCLITHLTARPLSCKLFSFLCLTFQPTHFHICSRLQPVQSLIPHGVHISSSTPSQSYLPSSHLPNTKRNGENESHSDLTLHPKTQTPSSTQTLSPLPTS